MPNGAIGAIRESSRVTEFFRNIPVIPQEGFILDKLEY
jgi:hypothetical protein